MYHPVSLSLFYCQTVKQPLQLAATNQQRPTAMLRPLKSPSLQAPVIEPKTIVLPSQQFQLVPSAIAKDEPLVRKRIQLEYGAYKSGEAVDGFPHICCARRQMHLPDRLDVQHTGPMLRSTSVKSSRSNPGFTSIVRRPILRQTPDPFSIAWSSWTWRGIQPIAGRRLGGSDFRNLLRQ